MRKTATWMQLLDERILEHIDEEDWATPRTMFRDVNFEGLRASEGRIRERCEKLAQAELIAPVHNDMYEITTTGKLYLEGELDAENLRVWSVG